MASLNAGLDYALRPTPADPRDELAAWAWVDARRGQEGTVGTPLEEDW